MIKSSERRSWQNHDAPETLPLHWMLDEAHRAFRFFLMQHMFKRPARNRHAVEFDGLILHGASGRDGARNLRGLQQEADVKIFQATSE